MQYVRAAGTATAGTAGGTDHQRTGRRRVVPRAEKGLLGQGRRVVRDHKERVEVPYGDRRGRYDVHGDGLHPHGQRRDVFGRYHRQRRPVRRGVYRHGVGRDRRHAAHGVPRAHAAGAGVGHGHQRVYRLYAHFRRDGADVCELHGLYASGRRHLPDPDDDGAAPQDL